MSQPRGETGLEAVSGIPAGACQPVDELPAEHHKLMRVFGKNTLWLLLDRAGLRVGALLAGLALIGYLGPAKVGIYSTALAIGTVLNALFDAGLTRYSARAVSAQVREAAPILSVCLTVTLVATLVEIAGLLLCWSAGNYFWACLWIGAIFTNFDGSSSLCSAILSALLRSRDVLPGSILNAAGTISIVFLVIRLKWSVFGLLMALTVKSLVVLSLRLWQLRAVLPNSPAYFTGREFARVLRNSWHFYSYSLTQIGYERIPIIAFGLIASHENVGLLSTALLLAGIFPSFTYASSDAVLPVMTRLFECGRIEDFKQMRGRMLDLLVLVCIPVGVILSLFAPQICLMLGSRFVLAAPALRIAAARSLLSVLDGFLGQATLPAVDRVRERRNAQALGLVCLVALTFALGWKFGAQGAAVATIASDAVIFLSYIRIFRRIGLPVHFPAPLGTVAALICMTLASLLASSRLPWPAAAVCGLAGYTLTWVLVARPHLRQAVTTFTQCYIRA